MNNNLQKSKISLAVSAAVLALTLSSPAALGQSNNPPPATGNAPTGGVAPPGTSPAGAGADTLAGGAAGAPKPFVPVADAGVYGAGAGATADLLGGVDPNQLGTLDKGALGNLAPSAV